MTIADKLQTIADNTQRVFNAGYLEGQEAGGYNEGFEDGRDSAVDPDKIIEATATGKGLVHLTEVSEVKHKIKVTTTAGAKVTVVRENLIPYPYTEAQAGVVEEHNGLTYTFNNDRSITITGRATAGSYVTIYRGLQITDTQIPTGGTNGTFFASPHITYLISSGVGRAVVSFSLSDMPADGSNINVTVYPMIYRDPIEYTADDSGIATVDSIAPTMYILSEVDMTVGYRKSWGIRYERDAFWDAYVDGLEKAGFRQAFTSNKWGFRNFFPTRNLNPVGDASQLFYDFGGTTDGVNDAAGDLAQRLRDCGVVLDTSKATSLKYAFSYARISCIPTIDVTGLVGDSIELFAHTWANLKKIEKIITNETVTYNNWFTNCTGLTDISFDGNIGNDINLQWSTKLSRYSIEHVINGAKGAVMDGSAEPTVTLSQAAVLAAYGSMEAFEEYLNEWGSVDPPYINLV